MTTKLTGRDYIRELARKRDKHTCQNCKRKWKKGERRFDCHHVQGCGILTYKYDRKKDLGNLVTLCHSCHLRGESVIKKMGVKIVDFSERIKRNEQILVLNKDKISRGVIAQRFNISPQMVYLIVTRRGGWSPPAWGGNDEWKKLGN